MTLKRLFPVLLAVMALVVSSFSVAKISPIVGFIGTATSTYTWHMDIYFVNRHGKRMADFKDQPEYKSAFERWFK